MHPPRHTQKKTKQIWMIFSDSCQTFGTHAVKIVTWKHRGEITIFNLNQIVAMYLYAHFCCLHFSCDWLPTKKKHDKPAVHKHEPIGDKTWGDNYFDICCLDWGVTKMQTTNANRGR